MSGFGAVTEVTLQMASHTQYLVHRYFYLAASTALNNMMWLALKGA